jgi:DNA-binding winged helix-turn-helix (wHTH) protein/TolB-like protein
MQPARARTGVLRFGVFEIDLDAGELCKDGNVVPLQDKPLQLLVLLAERAGRPVSREEIRDRLWGSDTFVEFDDSLNHIVKKLREALGDSAENPRFIKTLPRRGYRFLFPVQTEISTHARAREVPAGPQEIEERRADGQSRRSRIVIGLVIVAVLVSGALLRILPRPGTGSKAIQSLLILPLRSLDGGQNQDYLGEGISEQVTARLTLLPGLRLLASAAAKRVESSGISPQVAGQRLHADAVLVGSVRRGERKVRVNVQLIRTADGQILWAEGGLEVEGRDLLETEKLLAAAIASRLRGSLTRDQRSAISRVPATSAEAYELFVRGKLALRGSAPEGSQVAEQLFRQAIKLDPAFAESYAWLALAQYNRFARGLAGDEARKASLANARRALAIDSNVTAARRALITIFHSTGQAGEGLKEASILRQSGATDADSLAAIARAYQRAGMPDRAVPLCQQALSLDPEDNAIRENLAFSALFAGEHELGLRVVEGHPSLSNFVKAYNAEGLGRRDLAYSVALEWMQRPMTAPFSVSLCGDILQELGAGELARRIQRQRLAEFEREFASVNNERVRVGLGQICASLGEKKKALEQLRLALETNPGDPWTLFYASEIHARLGDERMALSTLRQAVDRGFLALHYVDFHFEHSAEGLYRFRNHPEFRAVREQLASKVARLRVQY